MLRHLLPVCAAGAFALATVPASAQIEGIPRYEHIIVIIAENHGYDQIVGNTQLAPHINKLAKDYGLARKYYGVVHPSKANYIAMIGGDTFGLHDDDAYYCRANSPGPYCDGASKIHPYVDHTLSERSLVDQLKERNLTWKGYYESIPPAGSMAVYFPDPHSPVHGQPNELYAAKHTAFINFRNVQEDADFAEKIVGFDRLFTDLATGQFPNYAHIVPNQCNDMHGLEAGPNVPADCEFDNDAGRIARGDKVIGDLVAKIMASPIWSKPRNAAIVITWDENEDPATTKGKGCCGHEPDSAANFGGGHIPTIVVTNHGPRGVTDDTPHNHYSLLRTTEAAFGITEYLRHANDTAAGVRTMVKLFALP
jgi:phosphatidylinositol-3-phosphatase